MADQKLCEQLMDELANLKELRLQIGRAYEKALDSRDFSECGDLRQRIRKILEGPGSEISKIRDIEIKKLKLLEQYVSQLRVAWESGLFGWKPVSTQQGLPLPSIIRNSQKYPMPSWKEVQEILNKNKEIIKEKSVQGFTKMLIVPFGYDLKMMTQKFKEKVRELDQEGMDKDGNDIPGKGIFSAGGEKVKFRRRSESYPVEIIASFDESNLVYYPSIFKKENHGGLTKEDVIKINGTWQICFVEDMPVIPVDGETVGGRTQIDREWCCIKGPKREIRLSEIKEAMENREGAQGKRQLKDPVKYRHEKGLTPEQYFWMQLTSLLAGEKPVLMDYDNNETRFTSLIECYAVLAERVLKGGWFEQEEAISLDLMHTENERGDFEDCGIRTSVNIK